MFEFYSDLQIESLNHIEKDFTSASMFIKWTDSAMSFWRNFFFQILSFSTRGATYLWV